MKYEVIVADEFTATIRGKELKITLPAELPAVSITKIFDYGLQRILNDASAGGKDEVEAMSKAEARWDTLKKGIIRQTTARIGDPVAREAKRLAVLWVQAQPKFKAWAEENKLKAADKEFTSKVNELADKRRDAFMEQAKANLEALKSIEVDEDDFDLDLMADGEPEEESEEVDESEDA